jgi:hypothetical protein
LLSANASSFAPTDVDASEYPNSDLSCASLDSSVQEEAYDAGWDQGDRVVAYLRGDAEHPPNILFNMILQQRDALGDGSLADAAHLSRRSYVAGFWARIEMQIRLRR